MLFPEESQNQALIAEYKVLNDQIWERGKAVWVVNTVLTPSSILVILEAYINLEKLGNVYAGLLSLFSLALVSSCLLNLWTTDKVNEICWNRVNEIEKILRIGGNGLIHSQVKATSWYKYRQSMWYAFFIMLIVAYIHVVISLFSIRF